jgi:hypothetical protein
MANQDWVSEQQFRNILFLLGFTREQENKIVDKINTISKKSLVRRVYDVMLSGQFTPTHREALQGFGM